MIPADGTLAEKRKAHLISKLARARGALLDSARSLPPPKQSRVFLGVWSPRHILAHLIGWDCTNLQAVSELRRHKVPSFYKYHDKDWASYNSKLVARHNRGSFRQLLASAQKSHARLLAELRTLPAEEIIENRGVRFRGCTVTIERLLEAEAEDEQTHHRQLQGLRRRNR